MTHTPTPWTVDAMGYIRGPESENILENHDNAEFACKAVNAHESLLMWAKTYQKEVCPPNHKDCGLCKAIARATLGEKQ